MSPFLTQVQLAKDAFEKRNYEAVISALELAYDSLEELVVESEVFQAINTSAQMVEQLIKLPEIKPSDFLDYALQQITRILRKIQHKQELNDREVVEAVLLFHRALKSLEQAAQLLNERGLKLGQAHAHLSVGIRQSSDGGLHLHLFGKSVPQNDHEQGKALQTSFLELLASDAKAAQLIGIASKLTAAGKYEESNLALKKILEKFPDMVGNCIIKMAANFFFMRQFPKAIEYYLQALKLGENAEIIEFNVWEACTEIIEQSTQEEEIKYWQDVFYKHFPQSKYLL